MGNFNDDKNRLRRSNWHRLITVHILGIDVDWENEHECMVEVDKIKSVGIAKARQLKEYIKSTGVVGNLQAWFRFDEADAHIDVNVKFPEPGLFGFDHDLLEEMREKLHTKFVEDKDSILECFSSVGDEIHESGLAQKFGQNENLTKFLSGTDKAKMEVDFGKAGVEVIDIKKFKTTASKFVDENSLEIVSGMVKYVDGYDQNVMLCDLVGMTGYVKLDIEEIPMCHVLMVVQNEDRPLTLKFAPVRNPLLPGERPREGKMVEVVAIGEPVVVQQKLQLDDSR